MSPLSPTSSARPPAGAARPADDPAEAARQFEAVLVRQFVEVMTKDLFQSEEGGLLSGQSDLQRDTLTDTLAEHLVDSGTFGIADLLMQQWDRAGRLPESTPAGPPSERPSLRSRAPELSPSMRGTASTARSGAMAAEAGGPGPADALDPQHQSAGRAQGPAGSIDPSLPPS
ncbi:rod-binding protein [Rubrivirga sp.]|uniref:rod-binding protein n=1 Tax=Rubrivirga sp. TaxID=1885344 RepID=UPI003B51AF87